MKLRIKSHSIRFRLKGDDMERLEREGEVLERTRIPAGDEIITFTHGLRRDDHLAESYMDAQPFSLVLVLSGADFAALRSFEKEGVYVRRHWKNADGQLVQFVAYAELDKDKKKHKHDKHKHGADNTAAPAEQESE